MVSFGDNCSLDDVGEAGPSPALTRNRRWPPREPRAGTPASPNVAPKHAVERRRRGSDALPLGRSASGTGARRSGGRQGRVRSVANPGAHRQWLAGGGGGVDGGARRARAPARRFARPGRAVRRGLAGAGHGQHRHGRRLRHPARWRRPDHLRRRARPGRTGSEMLQAGGPHDPGRQQRPAVRHRRRARRRAAASARRVATGTGPTSTGRARRGATRASGPVATAPPRARSRAGTSSRAPATPRIRRRTGRPRTSARRPRRRRSHPPPPRHRCRRPRRHRVRRRRCPGGGPAPTPGAGGPGGASPTTTATTVAPGSPSEGDTVPTADGARRPPRVRRRAPPATAPRRPRARSRSDPTASPAT